MDSIKNLNGKLWATSDNLGKQLIQKLGWAEGEGLGKNKQGSISHVKVSLKNDRDGIGMKSCKFSHNDGLLRTVDYDMLLKRKYEEVNGKKAEESLQRSMSRPKFGRAVKQEYFRPINNDDWTKITGSAVDTSAKADDDVPSKNENHTSECVQLSIESKTEIDSKFITKKMNVNEYFEMQMKIKLAKLKNLQSLPIEEISTTNNENSINSESDIKPSEENLSKLSEVKIKKKKNLKENILFDDKDISTEFVVTTDKVSKKRKKNIIEPTIDVKIEESRIKLQFVEDLLVNEPVPVEKKKSKKSITVTETEIKGDQIAKVNSGKAEVIKPKVLKSPLDTSNIKDIKGYKYY